MYNRGTIIRTRIIVPWYHQLIIIFCNFWVAPLYNFAIIHNKIKLVRFYLRIIAELCHIRKLGPETRGPKRGTRDPGKNS